MADLPPQSCLLPSISKLELQSHTSPHDLWISIHGKVYDVSSWLSSHPGGDTILLSLAGQDVTDAFMAFHPPQAALLLPNFLVATLSDYHVSPLSSDYRRTLADLKKAGLFRKDFFYYLRLCFVIACLTLVCLAGVFCSRSFWTHMGSAALLGVIWTQTSFIMHDYAHSAFLGKPRIDRAIQIIVANCLTGLSPTWWKRSHNAHHVSTNNLFHDPDLQLIPFFAVSSKLFASLYSHYHESRMTFDGLARHLVSYQHLTFYPVMLLARINLFAQAFIYFLSKRRLHNRAMEIGGIVVFWAWFLALLACLPNAYERLAFFLVSSAGTGIQHLQFCLNHFACEMNEDPKNRTEFLRSQVMGTLNIDCPSWMDWFHGGLQFQVEHHLFPHLPRHNLRKVSGMVKALCDKHDLPYVSVGFWEANRMLFKTLKTAALQARDWSQPLPKNLVWEAVNAQG